MMASNGERTGHRPRVDLRVAGAEALRQVMDIGVRRALGEHRRAGRPIAVWDYQAGAVRMVTPEEIPVADDIEMGPPGEADGGATPPSTP